MKIRLSFCPTGQGGGVDPSCSKGGESGGTRSAREATEKHSTATPEGRKALAAQREKQYAEYVAKGGKLAAQPAGQSKEEDKVNAPREEAAAKSAAAKSADAKAASEKAIQSKSSEDHVAAQKAHGEAAKAHAERGSKLHEAIHKGSAQEHGRMAKLWRGVERLKAAAEKGAGFAKSLSQSGASGRGGAGGRGGGGGGSPVKKKKKLKLSFCSTGEGGGVDPSCSPKFGGDAVKRMMLASQASGKAKAEMNVLKAAALHGKAAAANERAYKAILKDPQYGKIPGALQVRDLHAAKMHEHRDEMKKISDKVFNKAPERLKEIQAGDAKARVEAQIASVKADRFTQQIRIRGGQGARFYAAGAASSETKAIHEAQAYGLHNKAAAAHEKAGDSAKAAYHSQKAEYHEKQWEYHRSRMGER